MNLGDLSNEALLSIIAKIGKDMTAASNARNNAMERERMIYINEAHKRGILGMKSKKKYRVRN